VLGGASLPRYLLSLFGDDSLFVRETKVLLHCIVNNHSSSSPVTPCVVSEAMAEEETEERKV
jgi:hypothetical protein